MKKNYFIASICLFVALSSCTNSTNRTYESAQDNSSYGYTSDNSTYGTTKEKAAEKVKEKETKARSSSPYIGTLEFNDGINTWMIQINADGEFNEYIDGDATFDGSAKNGTVQMWTKDGEEKAYGSWYHYGTMGNEVSLRFLDESPLVHFKGGKDMFVSLYGPSIDFKELYIYESRQSYDAKHPKKRHKIKKIK